MATINNNALVGTAAIVPFLLVTSLPAAAIADLPYAEQTELELLTLPAAGATISDISIDPAVRSDEVARELDRIVTHMLGANNSIPIEHEKALFQNRWKLYI